MQLLIEDTDGGAVVEQQVRHAAQLRVMRPLVLHGVGRPALAAALGGIARSGVPCIVEEGSGQAADLASQTEPPDMGDTVSWTIAVWVGERNQHRWLIRPPDSLSVNADPVVLERHGGGHKLVYFGV